MISFKNLSKIYNKKSILKKNKETTLALDDISFDLPNKGFIGLSGKNGSGKTTLLNLLSTIDLNFEGEIIIDGYNVKKDYEFIRKNIISYVNQDNLFIDNLIAKENLEIIDTNIDNEIYKKFSIEDKINSKINEMSGGQKQKVSLLRGIIKNSTILLVDEPTSSLDETSTKKVFELLNEIAKEKLVILVSHDVEMMNAYCNIIIKLDNGKLIEIKKNSTLSDVIYDDKSITFYGNVNLHSISIDKLNEILDKYDKVIINREKGKKSYNEYDYSDSNIVDRIFDVSKKQKSILFRSYLKRITKKSILFSLVFAFLSLIISIFLDFRYFNENDFIYETFCKNQNLSMICIPDIPDDMKEYLTRKDLDNISKEYDLSIDYVYQNYNLNSFSFDSKNHYDNTLYSYVVTDFKNFEFKYGTAPTDYSKVAISDYIADGFINNTDMYENYEDILNKGIYVCNHNIKVSGIIKTKYEKYYNRELTQNEYDDYFLYSHYLLSTIYYVNDSKSSDITDVYAGGDFGPHLTVKVDPNLENNNCKINVKLANELNFDTSKNRFLKTSFGEVSIKEIVNDDEEDNIIYVSEEKRSKLKISDDGYRAFVIDISNREVFDALQEYSVNYICHSYKYIREALSNIKILKKLFLSLMIIFETLLLIASFVFLKINGNDNKKLYFLTRTVGYKDKDFIQNEIKVNSFVYLCFFILNYLIYFISYTIINASLSKAFSTEIVIFQLKWYTPLIVSLVFISFIFIIYLILAIRRKKKNLISFIK